MIEFFPDPPKGAAPSRCEKLMAGNLETNLESSKRAFLQPAALFSGLSPSLCPPAEEELGQLLTLALFSLSALQLPPHRFLVVRDPELRKKLLPFSSPPSLSDGLATLIVVCAELGPAGNPGEGSEENPTRRREQAMFLSGLATQVLLLTARALRWECRLIPAFDPEEIGRLIRLPPDHEVTMLLLVSKIRSPGELGNPPSPPPGSVLVDHF